MSVIDSGWGISTLDLPYIFERFYPGNSSHGATVVDGGIGLSIMNRIGGMHGESVEAGNAPARGALMSLPSVDSGETPCAREQFPT